jgi:alpha-D-ribose 1-methylphosphonate 5-triphosphate synthase subunit PhnH
MSALAKIFSGGFEEPVFQSQETFRAVMNAMAMPGSIGAINRTVDAPLPLNAATAAILLTLCDYETPVWLSASFSQASIKDWSAFHAGAPLTEKIADARFCFAARSNELPDIGSFALGTDEYPDRSATIVLQVASLEEGATLILKGPGIKNSSTIAPQGLPQNFLEAWGGNAALYPRGVDLVLSCGSQFICLPRTVKIWEA